jgi:hypothetical protein
VKIKSQKDFWSGLMFVAVGIGFAWGATNYSFGSSARPGPGYFPVRPGHPAGRPGCGSGAVQGADHRGRGRRPIGPIAWKPLIIIVGSVVVFGCDLPHLGMVMRCRC